jgi:hypothetical protein
MDIHQLIQEGEFAIIVSRPINRCQMPRDIRSTVCKFGCDREGSYVDVCDHLGFFVPKQ